MNAALDRLALPPAKLMSGDDYRESLRSYTPRVFLDGREVASVADEPGFAPGVNALAYTYDFALRPELEHLALQLSDLRGTEK